MSKPAPKNKRKKSIGELLGEAITGTVVGTKKKMEELSDIEDSPMVLRTMSKMPRVSLSPLEEITQEEKKEIKKPIKYYLRSGRMKGEMIKEVDEGEDESKKDVKESDEYVRDNEQSSIEEDSDGSSTIRVLNMEVFKRGGEGK